jgi:hypothetical protein
LAEVADQGEVWRDEFSLEPTSAAMSQYAYTALDVQM